MTERVEAEVVVAGGGPGGICAALAAARLGKKTVLATDRPVLGGNSSSEIRVWTRGATGAGNLYGEEMGIWGELKLRNLYLNQEGNPVFWDDVLLEQVLSEPNLKLYLNTHISGMETVGKGRIAWVSGFQMMTEKELRFEGAYYIDATGDGSLGAMAGLPYRMGKESRDTYGESFAPEEEERATFGSTLFFFTKREDHPVSYIAPDYAYPRETIEELLGKGGRIANEKMDGCDYWWFETGGMADTIREAQEIGLELKRFTAGVWDYIKNSGRYDADCLTLSWEGNMPGKRESRRFITKKILTQQDILEHRAFEDGAFYGGWYLDFHPSHGFKTEEDNCTQIPVQVYAVPLGCLYPTCDSNLLFAGRDIGVSHVAFASTRIMNTCALSGQAAGTLAARCIELGKRPGDLEAEEIQGVQQTLLRNDMMIPGIRHREERDLAREAGVSSSGAECRGGAFGDRNIFPVGRRNFGVSAAGGGDGVPGGERTNHRGLLPVLSERRAFQAGSGQPGGNHENRDSGGEKLGQISNSGGGCGRLYYPGVFRKPVRDLCDRRGAADRIFVGAGGQPPVLLSLPEAAGWLRTLRRVQRGKWLQPPVERAGLLDVRAGVWGRRGISVDQTGFSGA